MLKFGSKSDVTVVHRATIRLFDDNEIIYCDFQVSALRFRSVPLCAALRRPLTREEYPCERDSSRYPLRLSLIRLRAVIHEYRIERRIRGMFVTHLNPMYHDFRPFIDKGAARDSTRR